MARQWSNSGNGNLRYSVNRQNQSGIYIGPTRGLRSPKNSRRACLCIEKNTYSVSWCDDALIQQGHSIVVIEHNTDVMKYADWLIEIGPEGGEEGGYLIYEGLPEQLQKSKKSVTAAYLNF